MKNSGKLLVLVVMILALASFAYADNYNLSKDITSNVYLVQSNVEYNNSIYGDALFVSDNFALYGLVDQDLAVMSSDFLLNGTVGDDLRVVSSNIDVRGYVFNEALLFGNQINIENSSILGGPVKIYANTVTIDGVIRGDAKVYAERIVFNGVIEKNAYFESNDLVMGPDAQILGDLVTSDEESVNSSVVKGAVSEEKKEVVDIGGKLISFLMLVIVGFVVLIVARKFADKTTTAIEKRSFVSFITGLIILIATPIVGLLLLITIIGIPLALLLFIAYALILFLGAIYGVFAIGKGLFSIFDKKKKSLLLSMVLGALLVTLISFVPAIFTMVMLVLIVFGMGGFWLALRKKHNKKK